MVIQERDMTLEEKLEKYMKKMEEDGMDLSTALYPDILMGYYVSLGVTSETSFIDWINGVVEGKYPAYYSVIVAIRIARENNPKWRKKHKQQQVDAVKTEVGY